MIMITMATELPKKKCWHCGHVSVPRVPDPKRCPDCGRRYADDPALKKRKQK